MVDFNRTVWTIGHSTRGLDEFLGLLRENRIAALADVRRFPGSRKHPQFGKDALRASLSEIDIEYLHLPELGGRRAPHADSVNTAWRNPSFRGYADYMESPEFRSGIQKVKDLAERVPTVVMCAEAVWWKCHRALIADWLKVRGVEVLHILSENKVEPHPYSSAARVIDGQLSYRAPHEDATHAELPLS